MSELLPKLPSCQNCGTETAGKFCPECGQDSRDHTVSARLLIQDFASDVFTYDSRFFRSFIPLIIKPGSLTAEYTRGRRIRYIPPLRLYVFVSLLFFFVLSMKVNGQLREQGWFDHDPVAVDSTAVEEVINLLPSVPDSLPTGENAASWIAKRLQDDFEQANIDSIRAVQSMSASSTWGSDEWHTSDWSTDSSPGSIGDDFDKQAFVKGIQKLVPKFVFLLLPLFASLLALVYYRSNRKFIEHLVLSLHLHAFMFLLFTIAIISQTGWSALVVYLWIHIYLLIALRRVYKQGWLKTCVKFFLLTSAYNIIMFTLVISVIVSTAKLVEMSGDHPTLVLWLMG